MIEVGANPEAIETVMCAAVPAASLTPGRNRRTCASTAHEAVQHGGELHPVCGMHRQAWESNPDRQDALAARWGW